ncbi:hypothetical protein [Vibrio diabolicus]|uniref:DUF1837 domain-containing protein n=1 Tax=Vibrio diabolicus TaxID=50719 RepID=A0ABM6S731_9VIBR|nr:hypothetical protein [Vibrio diabolicus]AVH25811.1 hypothetical protein AL468_00495 [Vibrio diabolicus]
MFKLKPLDGKEPLVEGKEVIIPNIIEDFWKWSYSTIHNPQIRGFLAEYLVYRSLKSYSDFELFDDYFLTKIEGDVHDLKFGQSNRSYTIQVKSFESYTDSKDDNKTFNFAKATGFNPITNSDIKLKKHWSDFYVICEIKVSKEQCQLLETTHKKWNANNNRKTAVEIREYSDSQEALRKSIIDVDNWVFYVVRSKDLPDQSSMVADKFKDYINDGKVIMCSFKGITKAFDTLLESSSKIA